jgi:predicted pyridoxine 5'-phosphate oxidase superfamily flavin-nucleotide-binding protein
MSLVLLSDDMKAVVVGCRLGFVATVTPDGRPNLSPKGTVRIFDDHHLFYCDIASPGTRANLERNPWMEINVVDTLSRRGYRFLGRATPHTGDAIYETVTERIFREEGARYQVEAVVLLAVERALPIVSPGYDHLRDEDAMRARWKRRREMLAAEFEEHIARVGPWPGGALEEAE